MDEITLHQPPARSWGMPNVSPFCTKLEAYLRMAESKEPERLRPNLGAVRCPVRLVVGTAPHDGGIPEGQLEVLQGGLASFAVDSVPGAGLHVYEERPDAIVEAVRRVSPAAASP